MFPVSRQAIPSLLTEPIETENYPVEVAHRNAMLITFVKAIWCQQTYHQMAKAS